MKGGSATRDVIVRMRRGESYNDCQCRQCRPHGKSARLKRRRARRKLKQQVEEE